VVIIPFFIAAHNGLQASPNRAIKYKSIGDHQMTIKTLAIVMALSNARIEWNPARKEFTATTPAGYSTSGTLADIGRALSSLAQGA